MRHTGLPFLLLVVSSVLERVALLPDIGFPLLGVAIGLWIGGHLADYLRAHWTVRCSIERR